jgi:hypothetical protein
MKRILVLVIIGFLAFHLRFLADLPGIQSVLWPMTRSIVLPLTCRTPGLKSVFFPINFSRSGELSCAQQAAIGQLLGDQENQGRRFEVVSLKDGVFFFTNERSLRELNFLVVSKRLMNPSEQSVHEELKIPLSKGVAQVSEKDFAPGLYHFSDATDEQGGAVMEIALGGYLPAAVSAEAREEAQDQRILVLELKSCLEKLDALSSVRSTDLSCAVKVRSSLNERFPHSADDRSFMILSKSLDSLRMIQERLIAMNGYGKGSMPENDSLQSALKIQVSQARRSVELFLAGKG